MTSPVAEPDELLSVLLVEDDEDDFVLVREMFAEIPGRRFRIDWRKDFSAGLAAMTGNRHDVCLVDYRLGEANGIALLRAAQQRGCHAPVILLTGTRDRTVDLEAMKAGAADYLVKGQLDAALLERSIRYALERHHATERAAADQARLAAFGEKVGLALARRDALDGILRQCAQSMVQYLPAVAAYIWVYDSDEKVLHLRAGAGQSGAPADELARDDLSVPPAAIQKGHPVLINPPGNAGDGLNDSWARREGIVACAAYPLSLEDQLLGMMAVFSKEPLTEATLREMASVANGIALCIQRKLAEEALAASEVKYRSVVESLKEVVFRLDDCGQWTFLNSAWTAITGYTVNETLGRPFTDFLHADDREAQRTRIAGLTRGTRSIFRQEFRLVTADGFSRWVEGFGQPVLGGRHGCIEVAGTLTDISERKRAEAEIQKLAAFPRFNPEPVLELAVDGRITYLNDAAWEMARRLELGLLQEILPNNVAEVVRECLRTGRHKLRQEVVRHGRTLTWSFFPVTASLVVHGYGADITDRLNLEAQLRHAQKLESVGQLAAGVAHDFNNILTVIQGHTDRLLAQCGPGSSFISPLREVAGSVSRAAGLTRQLLAFSRKQVMQPRVLDLNNVIRQMGSMLERVLGEIITLELVCQPNLPPIEGDHGMIEQVILNLSVNARDAMPKGGRLRLSTEAAQIDEAYARERPEARPGRFVCLSVADNGCGMSCEVLSRVFEPFFTTKEVGKGTGLGLATVYGIVKQHQGWAEVNSEPALGTTFRVYLPVTHRRLELSPESAVAPEAVAGGDETILLVEDEPVLRELARTILRDYHYHVLEASNGMEALKIWEQSDGRVDLLLTDMVMPEGISGRELARQLQSRQPGLKVIFTSGYSPEFVGEFSSPRNTLFLPKPYPAMQLARAVRECLDY